LLTYITTKHLVTCITEELAIELCVCGSMSITIAAVGEELLCEYETRNMNNTL